VVADRENPARENPATENPDTEFDASRPHIARVYDYLLGGKDNFAADRVVGDQIIASLPAVQVGVRAQRDVLGRVVRYLVGEAGLRQLLDIGSGLPTAENVHEIAQKVDPPPAWSTWTMPRSSCCTPGPCSPTTP
jgi:hypothetical protein